MPTDLLKNFIDHFTRAIRQEMEAMRRRTGSFELPLGNGRRLEARPESEKVTYAFRALSTDARLVAGMECSLRHPGGEILVQITEIDGPELTLDCPREIELGNGLGTLVFYPWFLYERLLTALAGINECDFSVERALALFGKIKPKRKRGTLLRDHRGLNDSQQAAVRLCLESDLAFVWGPPGTGKTSTLAHIVDELQANHCDILLLSTTNAAVDQALAKIVRQPGLAGEIQAGRVVRIGRGDAASKELNVREVALRLDAEKREKLDFLLKQRSSVDLSLLGCKRALEILGEAEAPVQQMLFSPGPTVPPSVDLTNIFLSKRHTSLLRLPTHELAGMIRRRNERLGHIRNLIDARISSIRKALQGREQSVIENARVILTTLTNAWFSPHLAGRRFDVVIVEEASMAILPALFYAACLGRAKTVMVGDPCQLPAIVQSDSDYVRQVMGRNIFEVTVPDPLQSRIVAFLDVQYRMHPVIGALVSEVFYEGKLRHAANPVECADIAQFEPFPFAPLVVLDLAGGTICEKGPGGQSRQNVTSARVCIDLARRALRSGAKTVAVISPYVDQVRSIRSLLKDKQLDDGRIECSTVHRFQGSERDVIILDTVDAEPLPPGILLSETCRSSNPRNLINVAISRARGKLILVTEVAFFRKRAPEGMMTRVLEKALQAGRHVRREGSRPSFS